MSKAQINSTMLEQSGKTVEHSFIKMKDVFDRFNRMSFKIASLQITRLFRGDGL